MQAKPVALKILDIVSLIVLAIAAYLALVFAPTELVMGNVQRVFYFHIGTAWTALLGFLLAAVFSVAYLVTKDLKWDRMQVAAVEVSLVFFLITIVLGSIWARPAWNTWWTWDPRLTTAAVTELIYIAYFMLRQGIDDPDRRARFGAVYALIGGISLDLIGGGPFGASILGLLAVTLVADLLGGGLFRHRVVVPLITAVASTFAFHGVYLLVLTLFGWKIDLGDALLRVMLPSALINMVLGPLAYRVMAALHQRVNPSGLSW